MKQMTEQNLINSFGGESMAHMRYGHFSHRAEIENYPNIARLFRAISHAEYIHAVDHYRELKHLEGGFIANSMGAFGPGDTLKNLGLSIAGETFEIDEMYPAYMEVSKFQKEKGAYRSFEWSYKSEIMHKALFEKAKEAAEENKDADFGPIRVCELCGFTLEGEAPDPCPVCGAAKKKFSTFQ